MSKKIVTPLKREETCPGKDPFWLLCREWAPGGCCPLVDGTFTVVGVILRPLGSPGRACWGMAGGTTATFSLSCCDCRSFFKSTSFISSARSSSRSLRRPRSRCHISCWDSSLMGARGGISPSSLESDSDSAVPFMRGFSERIPLINASGLSA